MNATIVMPILITELFTILLTNTNNTALNVKLLQWLLPCS